MISLGINYSQMPDSSACIARDGEVVFAIAGDRLSRAKHDGRFPALAVHACLDFGGVRPDELAELIGQPGNSAQPRLAACE